MIHLECLLQMSSQNVHSATNNKIFVRRRYLYTIGIIYSKFHPYVKLNWSNLLAEVLGLRVMMYVFGGQRILTKLMVIPLKFV